MDDLIQDVFVEAAAGIARLREPEAIKGWLATIAVRTVRRRLRMRRAWRFLGLERDVGEMVLVDPRASPADRVLLRAVYKVLDEMPVQDRLAFTLHMIEGETLEAVAKLCGCGLTTAKRRVARGQRLHRAEDVGWVTGKICCGRSPLPAGGSTRVCPIGTSNAWWRRRGGGASAARPRCGRCSRPERPPSWR